MNSQEYLFRHLAGIFHTGVFCLCGEQLISYEENPEYNPLYQNEAFRLSLTAACERQTAPLIVRDDFHMFYICVKGTGESEKTGFPNSWAMVADMLEKNGHAEAIR